MFPTIDKDDECEADSIAKTEFANWKVNAPLLYDFVANHVLEWPSLTVQWYPNQLQLPSAPNELERQDVREQSILLGTHTTGGAEKNALLLLDVRLPTTSIPAVNRQYLHQTDYGGFSYGGQEPKFRIKGRINMDTEANRARHMPSMPHIVATIGAKGDASLFDWRTGSQIARLTGHSAEGWGMAWCRDEGSRGSKLVTVADDRHVCLWDIRSLENSSSIQKSTSGCTKIAPERMYKGHEAAPQSVSWKSDLGGNSFVTVGDDGRLIHWDARSPAPSHVIQASPLPVNGVDCCRSEIYLIATTGVDKDVVLWDDRHPLLPVHRMTGGHSEAACDVSFNPLKGHFLASSSQDRRVALWDLRRIGMEQRPEDAEDGPPEFLFQHGGHTESVSDISWNPNTSSEMMLASVSTDNQLQVWSLSEDMFLSEDTVDDEAAQDDVGFDVEGGVE